MQSRSLPRMSLFPRWITLLCCLLAAGSAMAQSLCIYDPLGAGGDYYSMYKDYQLAAKRWNVNVDLKAYTDDAKLDADFRSGACDMASMIGMRARMFNHFTGTIDAPGVIDNYAQLREVMALVANAKLAKYMSGNGYEVAGVMPIGPTYVMTSDRHINSFERARGKKVAVMGWDKTQSMMAEYFKVTPVGTDIPHYADLFKQGKVDILVAPMAIFKALELYQGMGTNGGIVRRPLFQFTMQLVDHQDKFPPDFGQKSREFMYTESDHAISLARNMEAEIDSRVWIYAVHSEVTEWTTGMRAALEQMTAAGNFDRRMLALLKRVRCKDNAEEPECAPTVEQQREARP